LNIEDETMTHSDKGHYAAKHAPGRRPDEKISALVRLKVEEGKLPCADAERIGAELGATMAEVGRTLDLLEVRISRCQLGLFYLQTGKIVRPEEKFTPELEKAIRGRLSDGRLPCADTWKIAAEISVPRLKVSSACEALKIRIKPCQLGAF
jgi:hypothetical protein